MEKSKLEKVKVYTIQYCPFCVRAKDLLKQRGIPFTEILIEEDDDKQWEALYALSKMRTMPQIFFGDRLIGGYTELAALDQKDKLAALK